MGFGILTDATLSVYAALGLDPEELTWQDLANCTNMPTELFYDEYEADKQVAITIDECCLSCPVMTQCLEYGMDNAEWGVWGGIFLVSGAPDKNRNNHKTEDVWQQIAETIA